MLRTHVRFRSAMFAPAPVGRRERPRPGEPLAAWLVESLPSRGLAPASVAAEAWGWRIEFGAENAAWLGCGPVEGADDVWQCFCNVRRTAADRSPVRRAGSRAQLTALVRALHELVSGEPAIGEVEWFCRTPEGAVADPGEHPFG